MATYKLIQDIEAEDHILGPLTLRQFIFALISVFCFYICFILITKHVQFLLIVFLPPAIFFGFFAIPFGRDQPTEIWILAKLRFWFKPRTRKWDQSGVKQLVTITVPKKIEKVLTNGLSTYEVQSRLKALANTLDSRGWAVKNARLGQGTVNYPSTPTIASDRLLDLADPTPTIPEEQVPAGADILDEDTSVISKHFDQMISESSQAHRQKLMQQMNASSVSASPATTNSSQWFIPTINDSPSQITAPVVAAQTETSDDVALGVKLKAQHDAQQAYYGNLRTLQPVGATQAVPPPITSPSTNYQSAPLTPNAALTDQPDPAILNLANNNDFSVGTIAREAKRAKGEELQDEVIISLH